MSNGFSISKISVDSVDGKGMPLVYKNDTIVECVQNFCAGSKELLQKLTLEEYRLYQSASDTIALIFKRNSVNKVLNISALSAVDFKNYSAAGRMKDSIIELRFPFHPQRKIYFDRENKNYKFFFSVPFAGETTYSFPLNFQKNTWYLVDELSGEGFFNTDCTFFIFIDGKGKMHKWHSCEPWSPV